jgi:hypothetical protein
LATLESAAPSPSESRLSESFSAFRRRSVTSRSTHSTWFVSVMRRNETSTSRTEPSPPENSISARSTSELWSAPWSAVL